MRLHMRMDSQQVTQVMPGVGPADSDSETQGFVKTFESKHIAVLQEWCAEESET